MAEPIVSIITCTGNRPEAFSLCKKYVERQTFKGTIQWVVIDDGKDAILDAGTLTRKNATVDTVRALRTWEPGLNTQRFNMEQALRAVTGDYIFIFEDDDWYHPEYIERMLFLLKKYPLVGEGNSKYFNIKARAWKEMRNTRSSSLSQTALHKSIMPLLKDAINSGEFFFDIHLWRNAYEKKIDSLIFTDKQLSVGMKGLPGRDGLGTGHKVNSNVNERWFPDPKFTKLEEWVGKDVDSYRKFVQAAKMQEIKKSLVGSTKAVHPAVNRKVAGSIPARPATQPATAIPVNLRPKLFKEND